MINETVNSEISLVEFLTIHYPEVLNEYYKHCEKNKTFLIQE